MSNVLAAVVWCVFPLFLVTRIVCSLVVGGALLGKLVGGRDDGSQ